MTLHTFGRYILTGCLAVALASCTGSPGMPQAAGQRSAVGDPSTRIDRTTWIYLFAPDGKLAIYTVNRYGRLHLNRTADVGSANLYGACSDTSGNVFVTRRKGDGSGEILELPHGQTTPVAVLKDSGEATGCSYDPVTGSLAVANYSDAMAPGGAAPDVAIYTNERGTPALYTVSRESFVSSCSYDGSGNLFIGGGGKGHAIHFALSELPAGSGTVERISLRPRIGQLHQQQAVQWDGADLAVTNHVEHGDIDRLYRLQISGQTATEIGRLAFGVNRAHQRLGSPYTWIHGGSIVGATDQGIGLWGYPGGHKPRTRSDRAGGGFISVTFSSPPGTQTPR
jgi:hypothetical protein